MENASSPSIDAGFLQKLKNTFSRLYHKSPDSVDLSDIPACDVLVSHRQYRRSIDRLKRMGLLRHNDGPKNWDSLAALAQIRRYCADRKAPVLDAGGEYYSMILPQLRSCGYSDLTCINLVFRDKIRKDGILFEYGDITHTRYPDASFGAITCLSVVEHGVEMNSFFKEMSRLLQPGGILFVSTDYWKETIDTQNKLAYGQPIRIFTAADITRFARMAGFYDLELISPLELESGEKVVCWKQYDLHYTFIYFTFRKKRI